MSETVVCAVLHLSATFTLMVRQVRRLCLHPYQIVESWCCTTKPKNILQWTQGETSCRPGETPLA